MEKLFYFKNGTILDLNQVQAIDRWLYDRDVFQAVLSGQRVVFYADENEYLALKEQWIKLKAS